MSRRNMCLAVYQIAKQKLKEEQEKRILDQRAKYIEKTRNIMHFDPVREDKPRKSGKVRRRKCIYLVKKKKNI